MDEIEARISWKGKMWGGGRYNTHAASSDEKAWRGRGWWGVAGAPGVEKRAWRGGAKKVAKAASRYNQRTADLSTLCHLANRLSIQNEPE